MKIRFQKKIFTPKTFLSIQIEILKALPLLIKVIKNKRIERSFIEKIMLATTAVNKCVMCARFHSEMAITNGVSRSEVVELLNMDLGTMQHTKFEIIALLYAQHYAETDRNPSESATKELYRFYGDDIAGEISLHIKLINYNNLIGNTFSALISRIRGMEIPNSSFLFELSFFIMFSPILLTTLLFNRLKENTFNFDYESPA